jgi:hypothetical protein
MDVFLSLEIDFETELNSSGVGRCRRDLARVRRQAALAVENDDIRRAKICMVQCIEHFNAQLAVHSFRETQVFEK